MLYIANAAELNLDTSEEAGRVICKYFLALNKDILTAAELKRLVGYVNNPVEVAITEAILSGLVKQKVRKTLLVVDEHGALFEKDKLFQFYIF